MQAIVEAGDATPEQLALGECSASIYVFRSELLWPALDQLKRHNEQGELYLTDAVRDLVERGERVAVHLAADPVETEGVNTRVDLAAAASTLRDRINERHLLAGVWIVDPSSTWIDPDVQIEPDVVVHPFTVLRGATRVAGGAGSGRTRSPSTPRSGPVRPSARSVTSPWNGARRSSEEAGTFVELKKARVGEDAKVPHLSYIGDAEIGEGTNIGAGSITANFRHKPGKPKGKTTIGRNVRVAVNTMFVAPVTVGDDGGLLPGRSSRTTSRTTRSSASRPARSVEETTKEEAERLSRRCPVSRVGAAPRVQDAGRTRDPAHAREASDGLLRPLAREHRKSDRGTARARAAPRRARGRAVPRSDLRARRASGRRRPSAASRA